MSCPKFGTPYYEIIVWYAADSVRALI